MQKKWRQNAEAIDVFLLPVNQRLVIYRCFMR
jgi:hypothetical protein